ncbi:MAG: hypothetical protein AB7O52_13250 [Planctomycetota bacterium]
MADDVRTGPPASALIALFVCGFCLLASLTGVAWLSSARRNADVEAERAQFRAAQEQLRFAQMQGLAESEDPVFDALSDADFERARVHGFDHQGFPDVASEVAARASLGRRLLVRGDWGAAAESLRRAYDLARGAWGVADRNVAEIELEFARALVAGGASREAEAILVRRLERGDHADSVPDTTELLGRARTGT